MIASLCLIFVVVFYFYVFFVLAVRVAIFIALWIVIWKRLWFFPKDLRRVVDCVITRACSV